MIILHKDALAGLLFLCKLYLGGVCSLETNLCCILSRDVMAANEERREQLMILFQAAGCVGDIEGGYKSRL